MTLWTYWQPGKWGTPPIVELMLETIQRHNPNAVVLDDNKVRDMGGQCVIDASEGRHLVHRSDLLRFWLLREFGGAWLDADYVCFRPVTLLDPLSDPGVDFVARKNVINGRIASNAIAAPKGSEFASAAYDDAVNRLTNWEKVGWLGTGPKVLTSIYQARADIRERTRLLPPNDYPQRFTNRLLVRQANDQIHRRSTIWYPGSVAYHVTAKTVRQCHEWPRKRLMKGWTFLSFLFRESVRYEQ